MRKKGNYRKRVGLILNVSDGGEQANREMLLCPAPLNARRARIHLSIHPSTGLERTSLISYWQPTGDTCSRASWRTYLLPSF